jgi:hypothetical protein
VTAVSFRATVEQGGKTATGIHVPDDVVAELGSGKRPAVRATIGDHTYRSTLGVMGGRTLLPVSADNRTKAGIAAGDKVDVRLELDTAPREVELPTDFATALDAVPEARRFFDALSYSQKRWFVLPIEEAKKPDTRERRIEKAVAMLREGKAQR